MTTQWSEVQTLASVISDGIKVERIPDGAGEDARWVLDYDAVVGPAFDALRDMTDAVDHRGGVELGDGRVLRLASDVADAVQRIARTADLQDYEDDRLTTRLQEWFEADGFEPSVDVFTGDLMAWAGSHAHWVEEDLDECGWEQGDLLGMVVARSQARWMQALAWALLAGLVEAAASMAEVEA
jgi:hypothetical protein